jgi:hypothetical protein
VSPEQDLPIVGGMLRALCAQRNGDRISTTPSYSGLQTHLAVCPLSIHAAGPSMCFMLYESQHGHRESTLHYTTVYHLRGSPGDAVQFSLSLLSVDCSQPKDEALPRSRILRVDLHSGEPLDLCIDPVQYCTLASRSHCKASSLWAAC